MALIKPAAMNQMIVCIGIGILFFAGLPSSGQGTHPVSVIFDTDIGPDYDDIGALAILHALADSGECTILATIASNNHRYAAAALSVMNTYFNRPGIPIGVVTGKAVSISASQRWDSLITTDYPHRIRTNADAEDALVLYRRILSSAADSSVTIVTVGFLTNMSNLLRSGPDSFSTLDGTALVARKVRRLVSMAGRFGEGADGFREFNVMMDASASKNTFDNWPTPIIFSGFEIGARIFTGLPIAGSGFLHSPVKDVFRRCIPMDPHDRNGRMSWDETAVLVAVRGPSGYFNVVKGRMVCHPDGSNGWDPKGGRDAYLTFRASPEELAAVINGLMMHQP
jgi:inosine-uridine nucleoside N-ribohydrolase